MEDSVTLDDINVSAIIQGSEAPFVDNNTVCSCRGMCLREKGRNACPCKNIGHFCSEACHEQTSSACLNRRSVADGDASSDTQVRYILAYLKQRTIYVWCNCFQYTIVYYSCTHIEWDVL